MPSNGQSHSNGKRSSSKAKSRSDGRRQLQSSRSMRQELDTEWLKDFLSEMLAVEKGGVQLYQKAIAELSHPELDEKLNEFLLQTERHVELCSEMLTEIGVDVDYQSAGAQAAEHKAEGLISTEVPEKLIDLNNIENLVLAETKDHWDWEMLAAVAPMIEDAGIKRMVTRAVKEVQRQETAHLNWNEKTLSMLAKESAMQTSTKMARNQRDAETPMK